MCRTFARTLTNVHDAYYVCCHMRPCFSEHMPFCKYNVSSDCPGKHQHACARELLYQVNVLGGLWHVLQAAHVCACGADISARQYPERLGTFLVVGAPRIFGGLWHMLQPLVDPVTRAKIKFLPCAAARLPCCAPFCHTLLC